MARARVLLATGLALASLNVDAFVSPRATLVGRRAGCRAATSRTFRQRMRMADEDIVDAAEKATDGVAAAIKDGADSVGKAAVEGAKDVALAAKDRVSLGGVEVSPLGVGAWSWGDTVFWGYSEAMDKELQEVFGNCVGGGVNLFDTAEVYGIGRSEYLCGKFRRDYKGADKDGIVIASKFAPLPWRLGRSSVVDACKASLDRMGAESMEIYQIHWPFGALDSRYWDGLADCVDQGLVKAVGVSNYGPEAVKDAHAALKARGVKLGSNQIQFSLANRKPETSGMLRLCEDLDVRVLAYSPLAQGLLTGKYSKDFVPSGPRGRVFKKKLPTVAPLVDKLTEIGTPRDKTPAQVSLNWCITKGTIPIPGAKNIRQADENCGALGWRLSEEEMSALDAAASAAGL
ncbi:unnamed protein product [Ectocarpus sp. 12 AP-2014]